MLVKDLIRDTIWLPGADYDALRKPKVSVLLPAFRRAKSGMFRRCVQSILAQTLRDIELIIIDDASTDGTAEQTDEFMKKDGRISCLRHPKNIGLPAVSEYEGYAKARAERIAFAFDDTMFNPDALERLLVESEKSPRAMIYGHVEMSARNEITGEVLTTRLGTPQSQGTLRAGNFIPNNGVMLPRFIIEDVGFYDPHILIARLCDWDLWCRIAERYEVKAVDVSVGIEDGPITNDSLGHTYSLDSWAVNEWMKTARNDRLLPSNLAEYEVLASDRSHGLCTQDVSYALAVKHAKQRHWTNPEAPLQNAGEGYILVVNYTYDASTYLYFDMLPPEIARRVRVITLNGGFGTEEMARASCVIFVRQIAPYSTWIDAAKAMKVPRYYFLDDNLPLLALRGEISSGNEDFRLTQYKEDLERFDGVLLSSRNLIEYFQEHLLHDNVQYFPVSFCDQTRLSIDYHEDRLPGEVVVACATGSHRAKGLWEVVFSAIEKLANEGQRVHLIAPEPSEDEYKRLVSRLPATMRVTLFPFETGYLFAMRRFARYSPDFLVHAPSATINNPYKTLHPLASALIMGAVPMLPATAPYDQITGIGNAVIVRDADDPESWHKAIKEALADQASLQSIRAENARYCQENFSGEVNVTTLRSILNRHGGEVLWQSQTDRLHAFSRWSRARSGTSSAASVEPAIEQACELAAFRKRLRYSLLRRILPSRGDLWNLVSPQFERLKVYSRDHGWKRHGSSLELSDSLHNIPFREYRISLPNGRLSAIYFALSVDFVRQGQIGVELVTPENYIKEHVVLDLDKLDLARPIRFDLRDVEAKAGEWGIRIFARSRAPVYVYEFINRAVFGLMFRQSTPFVEVKIS